MKKIKMILSSSVINDMRVRKECDFLLEMGYDVEVICWDRTCTLEEDLEIGRVKIKNIKVFSKYGSGIKQILNYIYFLFKVKKYLREKSIDILYCHDLDTLLFLLITFRKFKKVVVDFHEMIERERLGKFMNILLLLFSRIALKKVDGVVLVSKFQLERYSDILPTKKTFLYNFPSKLDFKDFIKNNNQEEEAIKINYTGSVRKAYKLDDLLYLAKKNPKIKVYINGEGTDLERLQRISQTSNINNVIFTGKFYCKDISKFYSGMDLTYCILEKNNINSRVAFPTKAFESLMLGIPLIANRGTFLGEYVEKYNVGFLIDSDNLFENTFEISNRIEKLKERISKLVSDGTFNFWWENQYDSYKNFLEEL